jgi:hypothetical protein
MVDSENSRHEPIPKTPTRPATTIVTPRTLLVTYDAGAKPPGGLSAGPDFDMTSVTASTERTEPERQAAEPWTVRALFARHKAVGIGAIALVAVLVAFTAVGVLASSPVVVSDSTTCTEWGNANYDQQTAYARLYIREHGALPGWGGKPASVVAAISTGCAQAYGNDVQDNVTVVQATKQ